jgi:hypothetical protein
VLKRIHTSDTRNGKAIGLSQVRSEMKGENPTEIALKATSLRRFLRVVVHWRPPAHHGTRDDLVVLPPHHPARDLVLNPVGAGAVHG